MIEYKVVIAKVGEAEETMNRFAMDGWQVISTAIPHMDAFTVKSCSIVITMARKAAI